MNSAVIDDDVVERSGLSLFTMLLNTAAAAAADVVERGRLLLFTRLLNAAAAAVEPNGSGSCGRCRAQRLLLPRRLLNAAAAAPADVVERGSCRCSRGCWMRQLLQLLTLLNPVAVEDADVEPGGCCCRRVVEPSDCWRCQRCRTREGVVGAETLMNGVVADVDVVSRARLWHLEPWLPFSYNMHYTSQYLKRWRFFLEGLKTPFDTNEPTAPYNIGQEWNLRKLPDRQWE